MTSKTENQLRCHSDLSRLGRNYIPTGQYTEIYFPSKGVRYIAINDNVDTINGEKRACTVLKHPE